MPIYRILYERVEQVVSLTMTNAICFTWIIILPAWNHNIQIDRMYNSKAHYSRVTVSMVFDRLAGLLVGCCR